MSASSQDIDAYVDEASLVQLAIDLTSIYSPTGGEREIAEFLYDKLRGMGLKTKLQPLPEDRFNVISVLEGTGEGPCLMFNGHLDISHTGAETSLPGGRYTFAHIEEEDLPLGYQPCGRLVEDEWVYGSGIFNMKSALASYIAAIDAIQRSGVRLKGDIVFAGVAGEIEKAPVDEYQDSRYRGFGAGTKYLITHGVSADACVLGEPSALCLAPGTFGSVWVKITTRGTISHTAWAHRAANAINKMMIIIDALNGWIPDYKKRHTYMSQEPGVNIAAVRGGWPWRATRTPVYCSLYMDIRINPDQHPLDAFREVRAFLAHLQREHQGLDSEIEMLVSSPGTIISMDEPIIKRVMAAHKKLAGSPPQVVFFPGGCDASHLNRYGIPTVIYGPGGRMRTGDIGWTPDDVTRGLGEGEHQNVADMLFSAKVYALAAYNFCSRPRSEVLGPPPQAA